LVPSAPRQASRRRDARRHAAFALVLAQDQNRLTQILVARRPLKTAASQPCGCARPPSAMFAPDGIRVPQDSDRAKTPEDGCFAALWLRSSAERHVRKTGIGYRRFRSREDP